MFDQLNDIEVRVLASLVEKAITTPEYYPLSLNALVNACNQKSNREPVVQFDSIMVNEALDGLKRRGLVRTIMGGDSRVPKYRHYLDEALELSPAEVAILAELMLRGPQTIGELRGRAERMHPFENTGQVEAMLDLLSGRVEPLVMRLPRQPGRKESRYAHLLAGPPEFGEEIEAMPAPGSSTGDRVRALEEQVAELRRMMEEMQAEFTEFKRQFE